MRQALYGITQTDKLSVSKHVRPVISAFTQTLHTLKTLHAYSMGDSALQIIFQATVIMNLIYASSSW